MVKIRVPATSANLGCGFDCLGIALSLYTIFTFEEIENGLLLFGFEEKYSNEENLVYKGFLKALEFLNKKVKGVKITIDCNIPVSRGLGSSATCVVGGIYGAYALTGTTINKEDIFMIATEIEGHPDNVSPAIFGGLTASSIVKNKPLTVNYDIYEDFMFQALIPNFETETVEARKALPEIISHEDAIYTLSRLSLVLKAFETYDLNLLNKAMDDKLHEPYRKKIIYEYKEVREICESIDSVCFMISGSGSTLINILKQEQSIHKIEEKLKKLSYKWDSILLHVDKEGAVVY